MMLFSVISGAAALGANIAQAVLVVGLPLTLFLLFLEAVGQSLLWYDDPMWVALLRPVGIALICRALLPGVASAASSVRAYWGRLRGQAILNRGGPKTLDETLFLFPGACHQCGSRELIDMEYWHPTEPLIIAGNGNNHIQDLIPLPPTLRHKLDCAHCGTTLRDETLRDERGLHRDSEYHPMRRGYRTSASPYLSDAAAMAVPDRIFRAAD